VTKSGTIKKADVENNPSEDDECWVTYDGKNHGDFFRDDYNKYNVIVSGRIDEVDGRASFAIPANLRGIAHVSKAIEKQRRVASEALLTLMAEYPHVEWIVFDGPSISAKDWLSANYSMSEAVDSISYEEYFPLSNEDAIRLLEEYNAQEGPFDEGDKLKSPEDFIYSCFLGAGAYVVVARRKKIVGAICWERLQRYIFLNYIGSTERGVGSELMRRCIAESRELNLPILVHPVNRSDEFYKKFGFSQRKEYSPGEFIREHGMRDQIENQIEEITPKKRKYFVFIPNQYFPPEIRKRGFGKEDFEQWVVLASSRREAAAKVWEKHGKRLLSLMEPNKTRFPRKVSLFVDDPVRQQPAGRMPPIQVLG